MNWQEIQDTVKSLTPEQIKADLPIMYVLEANEHYPAKEEAGRFRYFSPFRPDNDPSFDVFIDKNGNQRWGDFAEQRVGGNNRQGDVIDLVKRFMQVKLGRDPSFGELVTECRRYAADMVLAGWSAPTLQPRKSYDPEKALAMYEQSRVDAGGHDGVIAEFLSRRKDTLQSMDPAWLADTFGIGELPDRIVVPYFDRAGALVAYKTRNITGTMISAPGAGLYDHILYGEWLDDDPKKPVFMCEGETDAWAAKYALLDTFAVLALPTGANAGKEAQVESLRGRTVYLAFDGDAVGRNATMRWAMDLLAVDAEVLIVPLPDKMDVGKISNLAALIARARPPISIPANAPVPTSQGFERPAPNEKAAPELISNWTFEPERELYHESGRAYEGKIMPFNKSAHIMSTDLGSKQAVVRWSNSYGGSWYGTDRDAQLILARLQSSGVFLSSGRMAKVAGLHDGQFIWPNGQISHEYWAYVPPTNNIQLDKLITIQEGPWALEQITALRELHKHSVMDPILCWLAVAPLRSLVDAFPVLAVTGGSGSGKTTLLETVIPRFSGSSITSNLTGTTGYAVGAYAGSTNAFPVWFDEYRPGARKDTLETFNQVLRDAYTGQSSSKGGMNLNNVSEISTIPAIAPLVVSGEDAFTEQSHTERMVLVNLPKDGKDAEVLAAVQTWEPGSLPYAYLTWLSKVYIENPNLKLVIEPAGDESLPSRVRYNLGVLKYGWRLLQEFYAANGGVLEGEPILGRVSSEAKEAAKTNPIRDALVWALEEDDRESGVFDLGNTIGVRVESFVAFILQRKTFILPGGATAVRKYLVTNYGAKEAEFQGTFGARRGLVLAWDRL
jgi:hypothetical protein